MTDTEIADQLEVLNKDLYEGRGHQTVKYIITALRRGHRDWAEGTAYTESDKLWSVPEIRKFIHLNLCPIGYWENGKLIR